MGSLFNLAVQTIMFYITAVGNATLLKLFAALDMAIFAVYALLGWLKKVEFLHSTLLCAAILLWLSQELIEPQQHPARAPKKSTIVNNKLLEIENSSNKQSLPTAQHESNQVSPTAPPAEENTVLTIVSKSNESHSVCIA
ncbi:hypothetical protein GZH46_01811 [Fragariocoptes setiger]|uniref:Uncharacterized protein n=1 Tax=Fragariocoptes setiger TaxID=1670756 RepID=A0ABQ7S8A7_9ACAR|nr:hypothetical protein GZH46_01811 [Fragariocoptes setiger]